MNKPNQKKTDNELIAEFMGWVKCECGTPREDHYKFGKKNWQIHSVKRLRELARPR